MRGRHQRGAGCQQGERRRCKIERSVEARPGPKAHCRPQERRQVRAGDLEPPALPPELLALGRLEGGLHDRRDHGVRDETHVTPREHELEVIFLIFSH